jgi:hypothetical protein
VPHVRLLLAGFICLLVLLVVATGFGVWWMVTGFGGPRPITPPGEDSFEIAFPGSPRWVDNPVDLVKPDGTVEKATYTFRLFQYESSYPKEVYAVLPSIAWGWEPGGVNTKSHADRRSDLQLAEDHVGEVTGRLFGIQGRPEDAIPTTACGYPAVERVMSHPRSGLTYVLRGVTIKNRTYAMFVAGKDLTAESPQVRAFFDSFRPLGPPVLDPLPPPPDDELRLFARIVPFKSAAFAPSLNAVFTLNEGPTPERRRDGGEYTTPDPPGVLTRYHYPSFRREAVYTVAPPGDAGIRIDEKQKVLFLASSARGARDDGRGRVWYGEINRRGDLLAYDIPTPGPDARPEPVVPLKPRATTNLGLVFTDFALAPGGTAVLALTTDARLMKFGTPGLNTLGELSLPNSDPNLVPSAGGGKLYAFARPSAKPRAIREIDVGTLRVTKEVPVSGNPYLLAAGDGLVFTDTGRDGTYRIRMFDLRADPPTEQRLDAASYPAALRVSPDGRRLYISCLPDSQPSFHSWDLDEFLATKRTRRLGKAGWLEYRPQEFRRSTQAPMVSPDGKCLLLVTGEAFWLTGAGPVPEVDAPVRHSLQEAGK